MRRLRSGCHRNPHLHVAHAYRNLSPMARQRDDIYTHCFHSRSMTPPFPLDAHAFLALVGALPARPCVLTFAILLSAPFTSQLDELRSTSDMNTLFVPRNTSRTRPLIVALTDPYRSSKPAPKGQTNTHAPSCYPADSSDKPTWRARSSGGSEGRTRAG